MTIEPLLISNNAADIPPSAASTQPRAKMGVIGAKSAGVFGVPPSFHDFGDEIEALAVGFITGGESILVIESLVGGHQRLRISFSQDP
jgi:hypothetical protein